MITGMNHTGFVVRDLDRAVAFYRDVIGLKVVATRERQGKPISQVIGYNNAHLKIVVLSAGDGHLLELIHYVNPPSAPRPSNERSVIGAAHLAFTVDNIEEAFRHITSHGAIKLNPPVEVAPGRKGCYLQDPEGNWIELLEVRE